VITTARIAGEEFEDLAVRLLGAGHDMLFRARGSSMHPAVRDGDLLHVSPLCGAALDIGDIALYRSSRSGIVVHRVVDIRRQETKTLVLVKGDAAATPDPLVPVSRVLGRVVRIGRRGRTIVPRRWTSRRVAPLQARVFRLRRWGRRLLKQTHMGLRELIAAGMQGS